VTSPATPTPMDPVPTAESEDVVTARAAARISIEPEAAALFAQALARRAATPSLEAPNVLFIGPDAAPLHATASGPALGTVTLAESFIEAILLSGQGVTYQVVIAGISQELQHLERAVRSLRTVLPNASIELLCEPVNEPLARRAVRWGATDYHIAPITLPEILRKAMPPAPEPAAPQPILERLPTAPDESGKRITPQITLVSLPVMVQSVMIEDLLLGRANIAERGLAILQSYVKWPGALRLIPAVDGAAAELPAEAISAPLVHTGIQHGHLILEDVPVDLAPGAHSLLNQAATWLVGWIALGRRLEQLRSLAITDELSGAYNRRYFDKFVAGLVDKARDEHFRVSLLLFDIDNFKQYNDQYGHAAGDAIIRNLIGLLRRCTRPHDLVARIGGDEFAVVFWDNEAPRQPNSQHPRDAVAATERFRKAIASHDWEVQCKIQGQVSISGGIATFPWDAASFTALVGRADEALLRAKASGKNVILLHESAVGVAPVAPVIPPTPERN